MRYDKPILFVRETKRQYNPETGSWTEARSDKVKKYANITHMGAERQQAVFGDVKPTRLVVRLRMAYKHTYDYVEIDGEVFLVESDRLPSDRHSLVVIKNA